MSWIATHSGGKFDFTDIENADVDVNDIAHALAHICRFNGHTDQFYSVAEHSCHMAQYFINDENYADAIVALFHDAPEAYIGDVVRPLKKMYPVFEELEERIWRRIASVYSLPAEIPHSVKVADKRILLAEAEQLNADWDLDEWEDLGVKPLPGEVRCWDPVEAEAKFMQTYRFLCNMEIPQRA